MPVSQNSIIIHKLFNIHKGTTQLLWVPVAQHSVCSLFLSVLRQARQCKHKTTSLSMLIDVQYGSALQRLKMQSLSCFIINVAVSLRATIQPCGIVLRCVLCFILFERYMQWVRTKKKSSPNFQFENVKFYLMSITWTQQEENVNQLFIKMLKTKLKSQTHSPSCSSPPGLASVCIYLSFFECVWVQSLHISIKSALEEYGTIIFSIKSMACLI